MYGRVSDLGSRKVKVRQGPLVRLCSKVVSSGQASSVIYGARECKNIVHRLTALLIYTLGV